MAQATDQHDEDELLDLTHEDPPSTFIGETKTIIVGALVLLAALAWNSAFQSAFKESKILSHFGPWFYAVAVTLGGAGVAVALNK